MNSFLMWAGGLLAAVLAALFAGPYFVDWNGYRGVFEEEASRIIGRNVRVGGDVNVRLLPSPYVRFENLRIADSGGLTGEPFFAAKSFTMWLSVPPMLKGILEAERIELDQPVVRLAAKRDGEGNWSGFSVRSGSFPFVPSGVALDSVHVTDGVLSFDIEGGGRLGEIDRINGELIAQTLSGPFTFQGSARRGRTPFSIRLATSESDGRGGMRLKVRGKRTGTRNSYNFDGRLSGLDSQPKIVGTLGATISNWGKTSRAAPLDISARIEGDTTGAKFKAVTAAFESSGRPQTIAGKADVVWGARHTMDVALASQWLDLDNFARFGGPTEQPETTAGPQATNTPEVKAPKSTTPPWQVARGLLSGIIALMPTGTDAKVRFRLDQADLGGDSISNLQLVLGQDGNGPVRIETMRARLPGSGRLEISGDVESAEKGARFSGDLFVGGPSLARVKTWVFGSNGPGGNVSDGSFSIAGRLKLAPTSIALSQTRAEFSGLPVRGDVSWSIDGKNAKRLTVDLEGPELDSRWIGLQPITLAAILGTSEHGSETPNDQAAQAAATSALEQWNLGRDGEVSLRLRADKLHNGEQVLRAVDSQVVMKGHNVSIAALSFETPSGLQVSLDGDISNLDKAANGQIRWLVSAQDGLAVQPIEALIDAAGARDAGVARFLSAAAPFRLAGKLDLGGRSNGTADIDVDGQVRGGRMYGQLYFDGGLRGWDKLPADVTLNLEGARSRAVLELLALGGRTHAVSSGADLPMRAVFKAVGVPMQSMKAMGQAQSQRLTLIYNGSVSVTDANGAGIDASGGEIVVAARDARDVLALAGIPVGAGMTAARLDGLIDLTREESGTVFRPRDLKFGAATVAGRIALGANSDGVRTIDADVVVDKVDMAAMMSVLLAAAPASRTPGGDTNAPPSAIAAGSAAPTAAGTVADAKRELAAGVRHNVYAFKDQPFDPSVFKNLQGRIVMRAESFNAGPGLDIADAQINIQMKPDKIEAALVKGRALDGNVNATAHLEKGRAGVGLTGGFTLANAALAKLTRWDETGAAIPMASGRATMKLAFNGRALSPRALASVLTGKGEIKLTDAVVKGLSPQIVAMAADDVMAREVSALAPGADPAQATVRKKTSRRDADRDNASLADLEGALKERLGLGELDLGTRTIAIDVIDGAARLAPFSMKNEHGVTNARVTLDLGQLAVDGDFKLSSSATEGQAPWPPVSVVYSGTLAKLGALAPLVSAAALEREFLVRKLEHNVNELERLRRLDEEAAKRRRLREEERQRELEAARAQAAEEEEALQVPPELLPDDASANTGPGTPLPATAGPEGTAPTAEGVDPTALDDAQTEQQTKPTRAYRRARARVRPKRKPRRAPTAGDIMRQQF